MHVSSTSKRRMHRRTQQCIVGISFCIGFQFWVDAPIHRTTPEDGSPTLVHLNYRFVSAKMLSSIFSLTRRHALFLNLTGNIRHNKNSDRGHGYFIKSTGRDKTCHTDPQSLRILLEGARA